MAKDNDTDIGDEEFEPKPPTPLLVKVTFLLVVINLGIAGYGAFSPPEPIIVHAPSAAPAAPSNEPGPMAELDSFVVNLNEPDSPRYLKTKFEVELKNEESKVAFDQSMPAIRDGVLRHLSSLTVADTLGAESKRQIRDALLAVVQEEMDGKDQVKSLYFSEFVVQ